MKYFYLTILTVLFSGYLQSQTDSTKNNHIKYSISFKFTDGIFLNFEQVKQNKPVPKLKIVTNISYERYDFFEKILNNEEIQLYDKIGNVQLIKVSEIWGFSNKGVLYINYNEEFNRIPFIGKIGHFTANMTYTNNNYPNRYGNYNNYYPNSTGTELRQYLIDFETGTIFDFDYKTVEILLMKDLELFDEYNNLKKRKKRKLKFLYIRKYNKKNPLFFPK